MSNGIFIKRKVTFAQVSNEALRDEKISLKAKGLYSLIQSYITLEGFTLYKNYLMCLCKEGERSFGTAWKELKDTGYLKQYRKRSKNKGFIYEYELLDIANTSTPSLTNLAIDGTVSSTNQNKCKDRECTSQNIHTLNCTTYKTYPIQTEVDNNNTELNNTELNNTNLNISSSSNNNNLVNTEEEEEHTLINKLQEKLKEVKLNISNKNLNEIMQLYGPINTIKSINKAIAVHLSGNTINKIYNYLLAILTDMHQVKVTNVTIESKKSTFNDYEQREYDFDDLERKLLGWA